MDNQSYFMKCNLERKGYLQTEESCAQSELSSSSIFVDIKEAAASGKAIYQYIVDEIKRQIDSGELKSGQKLPTVREFADSIGIARGTIKHAYDELSSLGVIEMRQGKGTFVCGNGVKQLVSRKEDAMAAIDNMLAEMNRLAFSSREVEIFLKLKLDQWEMNNSEIKVTVVDCNRETLAVISKQISRIGGVEIYEVLLGDLQKNPYFIGGNVDLVVSTPNHMGEIENLIEQKDKALMVVLAPTQRTIVEVSRISEAKKVCVISDSNRFFEIIEKGFRNLNGTQTKLESVLFSDFKEEKTVKSIAQNRKYKNNEKEISEDNSEHNSENNFGHKIKLNIKNFEEYLKNVDAIIVPSDYRLYATSAQEEIIRNFATQKPLVNYEYQLDEGSMMYLTNKIKEF